MWTPARRYDGPLCFHRTYPGRAARASRRETHRHVGPLGHIRARLLVPGKQNISLGWTILVGAAAAIVGGFIANVIGVGDTPGPDWIKRFIQLGLAVAGIYWFLRLRESS